MFIGREAELRDLAACRTSSRSELCVVYGRRRIGKSTLLEEFVRGEPAFFYLAGREAKAQQLARFVRELGDALGDPLTGRVQVSSWNEALTLVDRSIEPFCARHGCGKMILILDEFQWMCNGAPELLSELQRFWDKRWQHSGRVFVILCGSAISFMLGEVLSRKSPLFGRRTRSFALRPFAAAEAERMLSGKGRFEVAESYLAVGGVPKYLETVRDYPSFRQAMTREAFTASGYFVDEVRFVLSEQLRETEHYFQVLRQLAHGAKGVTELVRATGIASGQMMFYLERLQLLGFVSRHVPFAARSSSKTVRYRLDDYFLRFYFAFIDPHLEQIRRSREGLRFDELVRNDWERHAGLCFEQFVRDHAGLVAAALGHELRKTGTYWQRPTKRKVGVQLDALIGCADGVTLVCECKWSRNRIGMEAVQQLRERTALYPNLRGDTLRLVLATANGATQDVQRVADISVVTLDDLFGNP